MLFAKNKAILFNFLLLLSTAVYSQDSLSYRLEAFGSVASGETTPFWIVNNTYGVVPLNPTGAYLRGGGFWKQKINKSSCFQAGVELIGSAGHSAHFYFHQFYGEITFHALQLRLGAKENYNSILDENLSSGDFSYSTNARPLPEINISMPSFEPIPYTKNRVFIRGDFAVGKLTDNKYTLKTKYPGEGYALDILWHHKSFFLQFRDPEKKFPLSIILGLEHAAQWGGWTSVNNVGDLPQSFSDFIKIVMGKEGASNATLGDQINVLGNHQGTLNVKVTYDASSFQINTYKQHYFEDKSGLEYANWRDGIWGVECRFNQVSLLNKFLLEYINTTNQSGPLHFLDYDTPSRGGGNDDYYNHDYYTTGWSHWGRSLGSPLITSPEYNKDGKIYFQNNRIKSIHIGLEGMLNDRLSYKILATEMRAWGRMSYPFETKKENFSAFAQVNYENPRWEGWTLGFQAAIDKGTLYGNNMGCAIKVCKSGILFSK